MLKHALPVLAAMAAASAHAQTGIASDNAGNYTTWGGSQTANNGSGFGNWSYNNTTPNGGFSGQFLGNSGEYGNGNINSGSGNAFGFYANQGANAEAQAIAPFSGGALAANQTFSLQMQNHFIANNGGQEGFSLQDGSGNNIFQFYFNGGSGDYFINVWTGIATGVQVDTTVGYTATPLALSFTQGAGNAWSFSIYEGSTLENTLTSASTGDSLWSSSISRVDLFSLNGGSSRSSDNDDLFFNNLQITSVPEPSTMVLFGLSGLAALMAVRRR